MTDEIRGRAEFERLLVQQPFNLKLREDYARFLMDQQSWEEAHTQFSLLMEASQGKAEPMVNAARCLLALDRSREAIALYARAKPLADFESDAQLEAAWQGTRLDRSHLQVVHEKPDNVIPLIRDAGQKISFADIAGMEALKQTLRLQIIEPFQRPGLFARFKKKAGGGVLLYGPPGCGKTMMARAIATECHASFLSVGITDVVSMWIGESERNLSLIFDKARTDRPAVLFFDELDALAFSRSKANSEHSRKIVNEFLAQLDGFDQYNDGVLILAATNMPWDIDAAIKRPGRFGKQIFVPPPDATARAKMFELKLEDMPKEKIDFAALGKRTEFFSGADIDGVIDEAKEQVLADIIRTGAERELTQADFARACEMTTPSTYDWLRTAQNLVQYGGGDRSYKDVETYLKSVKFR